MPLKHLFCKGKCAIIKGLLQNSKKWLNEGSYDKSGGEYEY